MKLPAYRKYKNGRSFFKITAPDLFEEIMVIGGRLSIKVIRAERLPERNFLNDLMYNFSEMAIEITETEYELMRKKAADTSGLS
jgi:hypothetical protein